MPSRHTHTVAQFADMFAALGAEARLKIMQLLLSAHPEGLVVGEMAATLGIPPSTMSHHLDKLKSERLISVRRDRTFLRCCANTETLEALLKFLFTECCQGRAAVDPRQVLKAEKRRCP